MDRALLEAASNGRQREYAWKTDCAENIEGASFLVFE